MLFYMIVGLTVLIDGYLIRKFLVHVSDCLNLVCHRTSLSKQFLSFVWALCLSIPETTTNTVATFSSKQSMEGFGFGLIIGSGIYGKCISKN